MRVVICTTRNKDHCVSTGGRSRHCMSKGDHGAKLYSTTPTPLCPYVFSQTLTFQNLIVKTLE